MESKPLDEMLAAALPDIKSRLKTEITNRVIEQSKWDINSLVTNAVNEWFKTELAAAIKDELESQKPAIRSAVKVFAEGAAQKIGEAMLLSLNEKLKNSWERKKIGEAIFG